MAAYAEGLNILKNANIGNRAHDIDAETTPLRDPDYYQYDLNIRGRGRAVAPRQRDRLVAARSARGCPAGGPATRPSSRGRVSDSGEGRWTIMAAIDEGVPAHVLSSALYERFSSRGEAEFANKLLSAMRHEFGGHLEKRGS